MTSGVDWVEDHRDPDGPATALVGAFAAGGSSRALLTRIGARYPPGTRYEYCTADSQVLDWVRERATGLGFRDALGDLWRALGCTADAVVAVDGDGVAMAGGGVAAAAGDWARIGLLQSTASDGDRDPAWVTASSRPSLPFLRARPAAPRRCRTHVGFGYHWWPLDDQGDRGVAADGSRGQFVYVDRPRRTVVVKTSEWPYADAAPRCALPRPDLPHAPRDRRRRSQRERSFNGESQGHHHVRADRRGRHRRQVRARARDAAADRRVRHRRRAGGRRHRARPRAGPAQRRRLARGRALPRGRRADPRQRRRRGDQHDCGHGRRPVPRPGRPVGLRRRHRPGQRHRAARARRGAAAGHLHAGLRQPELRRGQPGLRQHPGHAARGRQADPGAGRAAGAGDLRHRAPVVRQQAGRRGPDRRPADVPAVHGHPLRRPARARPAGGHGRAGPVGGGVVLVRDRAHADAVGGAVGAARGARAGGSGGQPLPRPGQQGHQRRSSSRTRSPSSRAMGAEVATADEAREILSLRPRG